MGLFTRRKITKATEATRIALEAGLAFRQMLVLAGLGQEALEQSKSEKIVAEIMDATFRAIERGNFNNSQPGNVSAAVFLACGGIETIKRTASLWDTKDLGAALLERRPSAIKTAT